MDKNAQITARIPASLASEFKRVCAADDRLVSQELRRLIRDRVAQNKGTSDERQLSEVA